MTKEFKHAALNVRDDKPIVYTAMSKHLFYFRMFISAYVLNNDGVPLNPFMITDYFLVDAVDRDIVRGANNNIVKISDEIWVFGAVSDGVLAEIKIGHELGKPVKFFKVVKNKDIIEIDKSEVVMEEEVESFRALL